MIDVFGTTQSGASVDKITLRGGGLTLSVLTLGAILQDVRLNGVPYSLTLGSPDLAAYEGGFMYFGALVGPVANRIGGAQANLDGTSYTFEANAPGGHTLHSGGCGLHQKVWDIVEQSENHVVLGTFAIDGEGGFPANRAWTARFSIDGDGQFSLTIRGQTDAVTWMNVVNHSYWNLDGEGDFHGHQMRIAADHYIPLSDELIPTGDLVDVTGTPMDFRQTRSLGASDHLDHNFCTAQGRVPLRPVLDLTGQKGVSMRLETTEPGVQIYDARGVGGTGYRGHDGQSYGARAGLAIEPQFWPDAPNDASFPSIRLEAGQDWLQISRFTFSKA